MFVRGAFWICCLLGCKVAFFLASLLETVVGILHARAGGCELGSCLPEALCGLGVGLDRFFMNLRFPGNSDCCSANLRVERQAVGNLLLQPLDLFCCIVQGRSDVLAPIGDRVFSQ